MKKFVKANHYEQNKLQKEAGTLSNSPHLNNIADPHKFKR